MVTLVLQYQYLIMTGPIPNNWTFYFPFNGVNFLCKGKMTSKNGLSRNYLNECPLGHEFKLFVINHDLSVI